MENEYKNIKFILFLLNFNKFVNKNQLLYFYHINSTWNYKKSNFPSTVKENPSVSTVSILKE